MVGWLPALNCECIAKMVCLYLFLCCRYVSGLVCDWRKAKHCVADAVHSVAKASASAIHMNGQQEHDQQPETEMQQHNHDHRQPHRQPTTSELTTKTTTLPSPQPNLNPNEPFDLQLFDPLRTLQFLVTELNTRLVGTLPGTCSYIRIYSLTHCR